MRSGKIKPYRGDLPPPSKVFQGGVVYASNRTDYYILDGDAPNQRQLDFMYRSGIDEELVLVSDETFMRPVWYLTESTYQSLQEWELNVLKDDQLVFYKNQPVKTIEWKQYCDEHGLKCFPPAEGETNLYYFPIILPDFLPVSCKEDFHYDKPKHEPIPPASWKMKELGLTLPTVFEYSSLRNIKGLLQDLIENYKVCIPPQNPSRCQAEEQVTMQPVPRCGDLGVSDSSCVYFLKVSNSAWPLPPATWLHYTVYSSEDRKYYIYTGPIPMPDKALKEMAGLYIDMEVLCVASGLWMRKAYYVNRVVMGQAEWKKQILYNVRDAAGNYFIATSFTQDDTVPTLEWKRQCQEQNLVCFVIQASVSEKWNAEYYLVYAVESPLMSRKTDSENVEQMGQVIKRKIEEQLSKKTTKNC